MCSILVTNKKLKDFVRVNQFLKNRGPDSTNLFQINDWSFLHNLLSLTGQSTLQPLIDLENQIVCIFNGEIYNYREFGEFPSDGCCLIPAYQRHGMDFPKFLDGEFTIVLVDFKKGVILLATDPFSTKPLWLGIDKKYMGVSTYRSGLEKMGFHSPGKIDANKIFAYKLYSFDKIYDSETTIFNLEQYKDSCV